MKKIKTYIIVFLCVLFAGMAIAIAAASKSVVPHVTPTPPGQVSPKEGQTELVFGYRAYKADEFPLSFLYMPTWHLQQENASDVDGSLRTILLTGNFLETVAIKIFDKPADVEGFIRDNVGAYAASEVQDLSAVKASIAGCAGYAWVSKDRGNVIGATGVFTNANYLFVMNIGAANKSDVFALVDFIQTIAAGCEGTTNLTFDLASLEYPFEASINAQSCCAGYNDICTNGYPCCTPPGNCTWYCEYKISGNNNFPTYGNAYMWMYNARYNGTKTYPTGGTIPEVGAIMVLDNSWYGLGHVAYITGINSNGSLNVMEQGCAGICTRSNSYSTSTLCAYLAGYIYVDGSAPEPSPKICSGTVDVETVIDDYNFSNVYNFQAYGPGRYYGSYAYGWGTSNSGYKNWFHWTKTTSSALCKGKWSFYIGTPGNYQILAYIPSTHGTAPNARYYLDGADIGGINQNIYYSVWVPIATRSLSAGTHNLMLYDNIAGGAGYDLAFDAIKVVRK
ncbi:MAG TPA: CHAP domain-containing protein [Candidatus Kapabacteria bacterium]|nr:CHAP domain-containing protein [Candidatus Kapabacteria bacterium]